MLVRIEDAIVSVEYFNSHSTHTPSLQEAARAHPMSKETKSFIEQKLLLRHRPREILRFLRGDGNPSRDDRDAAVTMNKRANFVTIGAIRKIQKRVHQQPCLHSDDATSVMYLIECLKRERYNPVLLFKPYGAPVQDGADVLINGQQLGQLGEDDIDKELFVVAIQTKDQLEMLKLHGSKIICMDATHGVDQYKHQMFSVLVKDRFGRGCAVGHCISSSMSAPGIFFSEQ